MSSNSSVARTNLGFLMLTCGRFTEAEEQFKKVIEMDPHSHEVWNGLGLLQSLYLGQFECARNSFTMATKLAPLNALYQNSLGNLEYDHFHDTKTAEKHFKKALKLDPMEDAVRLNYAFMLRDTLGKSEEAKEVLVPLTQPGMWKDTKALHKALFAAYNNNWGQATEALKSALEEIKNSAFPRNTHDDWCRASAVFIKLGLAPKLIEFLKLEGVSETMMPWFEALRAHVVGDRQMLLNIPAEARDAAGILFDEIAKRLPLVKSN